MPNVFQEDTGPKYFLRLIQDKDDVDLCLVGEDGKPHPRGRILSIRSDGRLMFATNIDPDAAKAAGVRLTEEGRKIQIY